MSNVCQPARKSAAGDRVAGDGTFLSLSVLYAGFALTGLACVLPGVLLPMLLHLWGWSDRQGGQWFLMITGGSAVGPLTIGKHPRRSIALGFLLAASAAGGWCLGGTLAPGAGFVWGLGLGMAMTGISLLSQATMRDHTGALLRLNFLWALGAVICPLLAGLALRTHSVFTVLWGTASLLGLVGLASVATLTGGGPSPQEQPPAHGSLVHGVLARWTSYWSLRGVPLGLFAATALATGVEASAGAWLATYAERSAHTLHLTIAAPGCLWAGLLSSRALGWLGDRWLRHRSALRAFLVLVLLATGGLVLPFQRFLLLSCSFFLGLGLGPLYPALLARCLMYRQTSLVFFAAGFASAVMPWATGVVSTGTGLLRVGLAVPFAGAAVLALTGWRAEGSGYPGGN